MITNLAKNTEYLSRTDVVQLLHVSSSKAYILLKKLVDQGVLEPVNKGHYAKYKYRAKKSNRKSNAFPTHSNALNALEYNNPTQKCVGMLQACGNPCHIRTSDRGCHIYV